MAGGERSRMLSPEDLVAADPDFIFVAPCGFEERRAADDAQAMWTKHAWWPQLRDDASLGGAALHTPEAASS